MIKQPEILAPAGSMESFKAAIGAGCDAIYTGGQKFGARAYAGNFDKEQMIEAIDFAHFNSVKVYMTTNTLVKNHEIKEEFLDYLLPYYEAGLDAVIVQDIGLMKVIHDNFKNLDIHASTQSTMSTHISANELKKYGLTRVVPPRELSISELSEYRKNTDLELEVFTHGALCYCYSGQCLMSSFVGGRSGNRGRCAQPCRKYYTAQGEKGYILSPKDICTLDIIPDIVDAGVDSFKIEGRMKKPEYVALCSSIYKKYVSLYCKLGRESYSQYIIDNTDEFRNDYMKLSDIYNRGGFSQGYFNEHNGRDMICIDRPNHYGTFVGKVVKSAPGKCTIESGISIGNHDVLEIRGKSEKDTYEFTVGCSYEKGDLITTNVSKNIRLSKGQKVYRMRNQNLIDSLQNYTDMAIKRKINIIFYGHIGENAILSADCDGFKVSVEGNVVSQAKSAAVTDDRIKKQLSKLGSTNFLPENIVIDIDNNVFISMGELSNLKRQAASQLEEMITNSRHRIAENNHDKIFDVVTKEKEITDKITISASFNSDKSIFEMLINSKFISKIFIDIWEKNINYYIDKIQENRKQGVIVLPTVIRYDYLKQIKKSILEMNEYSENINYQVNSFEGLLLLKSAGIVKKRIIAGPGLYCFNDVSREIVDEYSNKQFVPYELSLDEIKSFDNCPSDIQIYGSIPVMTSAQCVEKTTNGCSKKNAVVKFIENGNTYFAKSICKYCQSIIYSNKKIDYTCEYKKLKECGINHFYFNFTNESMDEIKALLDKFEKMYNNDVIRDKVTNCDNKYFEIGVM